ncbi:MAG: hypothetical protein AAF513_17310 [Pseudomonadota bacterium]
MIRTNLKTHALMVLLSLWLLSACQGEQTTGASAAKPEEPSMPGFLDEPPPPPTSDNLILSGGTLVTADARITDAVVVIAAGELNGWGQRGQVDVPNDSIGYDMRAKWIVPGNQADLDNGALPNPARLTTDKDAAFLIFDDPTTWETPIGAFENGNLTLPPVEDD